MKFKRMGFSVTVNYQSPLHNFLAKYDDTSVVPAMYIWRKYVCNKSGTSKTLKRCCRHKIALLIIYPNKVTCKMDQLKLK